MTFISMLRAINVSGQNRIAMPELKRLYEGLGLTNVQTYVQSGNVVFDSPGRAAAELAAAIEAQIAQKFALKVAVFVRDVEDFQRILDGNPFLTGRNESTAFLHVTFLNQMPTAAQWSSLKAPGGVSDEFVPGVQEVFLFCPNGYGRTKLNNTFFERKFGITATTRNWNTVQALYKMAAER